MPLRRLWQPAITTKRASSAARAGDLARHSRARTIHFSQRISVRWLPITGSATSSSAHERRISRLWPCGRLSQDRRHPNAITILNDYRSCWQRDDHAEAEKLQREAIEVGRQVLGAETLTVANLVTPGRHGEFPGRHGEAERRVRDAFETHRVLFGERHWRTANVARNVGRALAMQQRYREAVAWMDRAIEALSSVNPARSPRTGPRVCSGCARSAPTCCFD